MNFHAKNLNFQLKETPYSLNLSIKKRFTTLWNQNSVSFQDFSTESNDPIFPQQDQTSQQFQQHQSLQVELQKHIETQHQYVYTTHSGGDFIPNDLVLGGKLDSAQDAISEDDGNGGFISFHSGYFDACGELRRR